MAENKGTGHHPHKSSEEPYPHHEAPTTSGQGHSSSEGRSQSGQQASSSHSGSHSGSSHSSGHRSDSSSRSENRSESRGKSEDMNSREYKGSHGEEHHHTKTYMEQHKKSA